MDFNCFQSFVKNSLPYKSHVTRFLAEYLRTRVKTLLSGGAIYTRIALLLYNNYNPFNCRFRLKSGAVCD